MRHIWLLPIIIGATAFPATAADRIASRRLDPLTACLKIADGAARLACYDREAAALAKAVTDRQVVVIEQTEIHRSQRELFGVTLPAVHLFDALGEPDLGKLETMVASVGHTGDGRLTFTVTEGGQWEQTDDVPIYSVKPGRKVTLKRAALGSFFASFDKGASVRVKRTK